jgi:hypothetical protein
MRYKYRLLSDHCLKELGLVKVFNLQKSRGGFDKWKKNRKKLAKIEIKNFFIFWKLKTFDFLRYKDIFIIWKLKTFKQNKIYVNWNWKIIIMVAL